MYLSTEVETTRSWNYFIHVYDSFLKMSPLKPKIRYIYYPFYIYGRKNYRFFIVEVQLFTFFLLYISEILWKTVETYQQNSPPIQHIFTFKLASIMRKFSSTKKIHCVQWCHFLRQFQTGLHHRYISSLNFLKKYQLRTNLKKKKCSTNWLIDPGFVDF